MMKQAVLESDALMAFLVFAESCNFTKAARDLHLSQPALHVKIQKLAESVGERLYERQGRQLFLTPAGKSLARFARNQRVSVEEFIADLKGLESRPLTLGCGRGAFLDVIDEGVAQALKQQIELRFAMGNTPELIEMVDDGTADVAVGVFEQHSSRLVVTTLARYGHNLVVPRRHRLARADSLSLSDLDGMALALPPLRWPQRRVFDQVMASAGVAYQTAVEAPGWDLLMHIVKLGVAPAVVNGCVSTLPGTVAIPLQGLPEVTYSAATRRNTNPRVSALIDILKLHVR